MTTIQKEWYFALRRYWSPSKAIKIDRRCGLSVAHVRSVVRGDEFDHLLKIAVA